MTCAWSSPRPGRTPPQSPIGASIACSGCCLTAIEVGRRLVRRQRLGRDAVEDHARHLAGRHAGQPGARAAHRRRAGRPYRLRPCRRRRRGACPPTPENGSTRWLFRVPQPLARFIAPKGSVADRRRLADRQRGATGRDFGVNIIPHTAAVTTLRRCCRPGDPVNIEIDMLARYVARLHGVPMTDDCSHRQPVRLPRLGRGTDRGGAQRPHVHPGRRRGPRERGRPRHPGAVRDAGRDQLHGPPRPRPDLPGDDAPARGAAGPAADEPVQRHAPPDRLHRLDRGAGRRHHRHLGARPRAHHRRGDQSGGGPRRHRHARAMFSRWWRARAARWCAPAIPRRRSTSRAWPASTRRRDLRDHERRRHHGAAAGPGRLRAAPQPEARHHRRPDRLPPPHRAAGEARRARACCTTRSAATGG